MVYFFRTIQEGKSNRLRPMPFQHLQSGEAIFTQLNTQADTAMRMEYPIGTVFASEQCEMRTGGNTPFYAAGEIFPVSVPDEKLTAISHRPTDEMKKAWLEYSAAHQDLNDAGNPNTGVFTEGASAKKPLSMLEKIQMNPSFAIPTIDKDEFYVDPEIWWPLMLNIIDNQPTMYLGEAGTGKTELCMKAAEKLGLPYKVFDMGTMYDPISEMLGVHRLGKNGESVFDYAAFVEAIQHKGVIIFDEITRAAPTVLNIILPMLDSRHALPVEMAGEHDKRQVPVHPECRFLATGNFGAAYSGTFNQGYLDPALEDRFEITKIGQMPADMEVAMLQKRYRIGNADATNVVTVAATLRGIFAQGELRKNVTTRDTIRIAKKIKQGFTAKKAMELILLPKYEGTKSEGEQSIVWNTILAR